MSQRHVGYCVAVLLAIQAGLLGYSAKVHSPTWDEVGHLAAGISHWQLGRFDLYSVNPPLVRTIAAAPVALLSKPEMDWGFYRNDPSLRTEVFVGRRMMEMNGADSFRHFFYARLAVIPIALLGGWLCFLWGRDLFGSYAGLTALAFWTFSPNVLAYGSVITPDLASAVALIGSSYVFWRWLKEPNWSWCLVLCGSLALSMLTKSVWLALPIVFAAIWATNALVSRPKRGADETATSSAGRLGRWFASPAGSQSVQLFAASLLALVITNGFYGFQQSMRPLGDFEFVSSSFTGNPAVARNARPECATCNPIKQFVIERGNRFSEGLLASVPVPLPGNYLQGIDVQTRDFERGWYDKSWQSYLLGEWKQGGWWYYYIVGLFVKVPMATWCLLGIGTISALFWRPEKSALLGAACLWVPAIIFFVIVSSMTGLNRYVRYALPVLPILFVWGSQVGRLIEQSEQASVRKFAGGLTATLCAWLAFVAVSNAPHHLSYFNEVAGGSENGHKYLCDSNVDWGQDLRYLDSWLEDQPAAKANLQLAYFGSFDPKSVGIEYQLPPADESENPRNLAVSTFLPHVRDLSVEPGWYVISKNYIAGHPMPVPDGRNNLQFKYLGRNAFAYFRDMTPVDEIGDSMLVYHVTERHDSEIMVAQHDTVTQQAIGN